MDEEEFWNDVKNHSLKIAKDDNIYRHLIVSQGSSTHKYEIITWPGYLTICGDMGTTTFRRTHDMFDFFRGNLKYYCCAEVAVSESREKISEFDYDAFKKAVIESTFMQLNLNNESQIPGNIYSEISRIFEIEDEGECYTRMYNFHSKNVEFDGFFEANFTKLTHHFQWQIRAINYAIQLYDKSKKNGT